jgi:hypothetical protein
VTWCDVVLAVGAASVSVIGGYPPHGTPQPYRRNSPTKPQDFYHTSVAEAWCVLCRYQLVQYLPMSVIGGYLAYIGKGPTHPTEQQQQQQAGLRRSMWRLCVEPGVD